MEILAVDADANSNLNEVLGVEVEEHAKQDPPPHKALQKELLHIFHVGDLAIIEYISRHPPMSACMTRSARLPFR